MNLFQTTEYLEIFKKHFCLPAQAGEEKDIVEGIWEKYEDGLILLGMKPVLGGQEVTDYAPMNLSILPKGYKKIQLDYVREDSETYKYFQKQQPFDCAQGFQEVSPYIDLPRTWEEYLGGLERKHRKELKRKFKRLETIKYEFVTGDNLEEFFRLHKLSDPAKNKFMSEPMAGFFKDVYEAKIPGWQARLDFLKTEGKYVSGIMSFVSEGEWWLYNSGYDPQFSFYSVGLLLKAWSIRQAIQAGKKKYDFLRGNERYKYELGAKDLQLYRIEINR